MTKRILLLPCAATLLALASSLAVACGNNHHSWPEGATVCISHHQFECKQFGVWHKLPGSCQADTPPPGAEVTDPTNKPPAAEQGKAPPAPRKPTSNSN